MRVRAREPLGRGTGHLGCAGCARAGRPAGPRQRFGQKPNSNKKTFFFFKTVYKLQINLNSNQI
jgi:hypothetical protein